MTLDLFDETAPVCEPLAPGVMLLRRWAEAEGPGLLADVQHVLTQAPLRHLLTPGGLRMSVAMSNCGEQGWVSDAGGYRYSVADPATGQSWPAMPHSLKTLATEAALRAGFEGFVPDACLVNRYVPGARLTLHQDRDERDFAQPIVSVSFGLPAVFLLGGLKRADTPLRLQLTHGDVVVWGGPARLRYHGVLAIKPGEHPLTGACRINLTFRRAA